MAFRDSGQDTVERAGSLCVVIENDFLSTWSHKLREEEKEEACQVAECLSQEV